MGKKVCHDGWFGDRSADPGHCSSAALVAARTGVVARGADGRLSVAFDQERCDGCGGGCGLRLGGTPSLALSDLRVGSTVEVVVKTSRLLGRAALVFGVPVAATVGVAVSAHGGAWHDVLVLGATVVGLAVPLLLRPFERRPCAVVVRGGALRVELR